MVVELLVFKNVFNFLLDPAVPTKSMDCALEGIYISNYPDGHEGMSLDGLGLFSLSSVRSCSS